MQRARTMLRTWQPASLHTMITTPICGTRTTGTGTRAPQAALLLILESPSVFVWIGRTHESLVTRPVRPICRFRDSSWLQRWMRLIVKPFAARRPKPRYALIHASPTLPGLHVQDPPPRCDRHRLRPAGGPQLPEQ